MDLNATTPCRHYLTGYNRTGFEFLETHIPTVINSSRFLPPIWWFVGIIGNTIALIVWLHPKMRHSSGYYLAALAVSDLCFLPLNVIFETHYTHKNSLLDKPVLCEAYAILYLSVQYMSPVLVLAFTVERYLSVCHPFRMVNFNSRSNKLTILIILILLLVCFSINAVQGYFWTTNHPDKSSCDLRAEILLTGVWTIWTWVVEMLIFAAVPLAILVLNVLVIMEVSNISKLEKRNMRTNSIDRRSTTLMLLGVSFYQILTVLPVTIVYSLYGKFKPGNECFNDDQIAEDETWQTYINYFSARIIIQNIGMSHYAANFFIYLFTGKIFRRQLYELFMFVFCKHKLQKYISTTRTSTRVTGFSLTSRGSTGKSLKNSLRLKAIEKCNNETDFSHKGRMYNDLDLESHDGSVAGNFRILKNGGHAKLPTFAEEADELISERAEDNS